jgi:survival of motor neuron protein-interacting protein 1
MEESERWSNTQEDNSTYYEDEEEEEEEGYYWDEEEAAAAEEAGAMGPRAFAVDYEIGPEAGPPMDGLDYLRRVRWEANRCPKVVKSGIDPRKFDTKQTQFAELPPEFAACPVSLAPSLAWETHFLASFEQLRQQLHKRLSRKPSSEQEAPKLPPLRNAKEWKVLCLGADQPSTPTTYTAPTTTTSSSPSISTIASEATPMITSPSTSTSPSSSTSPSTSVQPILSILQHLDTVSINKLLEYHTSWAKKGPTTTEAAMQWLFALLACLDKPLDADMASSLRGLLRRLALERSQITNREDQRLPALNILITIIAKYFGQGG